MELINTGSELLLGFTVNTRASYLGRKLADFGLRIARQTTIGDDRPEMAVTVADALQRSDILIITGGLGPTSDDFTREVVADLLGRNLVRDETVARRRLANASSRRGMRDAGTSVGAGARCRWVPGYWRIQTAPRRDMPWKNKGKLIFLFARSAPRIRADV